MTAVAAASPTSIALDDPRWIELASGHEDATVFHHPRWARLLADTYGYEPLLCTVADAGGRVVAGIPLLHVRSRLTGERAVGLAFTDFCPPLLTAAGGRDDLVRALQAARLAQAWPRIEVRWDLGGGHELFPGETVLRHTTALSRDADAVFATFKKTRVKQPVRQARDAGVTVRSSTGWEGTRAFYDLHLRTRRRLGVPTQPLRFFRLVWERLISEGFGYVLLACDGPRVVAGGVFLRWNGVTTYKYGASEADAWRLRPNHLLLWEAIQHACAAGDRLFDWGRTDLGNEGLRTFKLGWAQERELSYTVLAEEPSPRGPRRGEAALAKVIRRSPVWVSRAIGKALYGHFG
ncbi:MAG: GNAT family N-acetyltransferase [Actinomycetota bacterium]|nr:GNAT family N-acetyltransferase [Actinomycetota bacterium]